VARLEGALEADRRDYGAVAQALAVHGVDAVREQHEAFPDVGTEAEGEVEEVLAPEIDAEQRQSRGPGRREVEEARFIRRRGALELAPSEEREREPETRDHVDVEAGSVARLALCRVYGVDVDRRVDVRLHPRPEQGRGVERRGDPEVARALEVVDASR